MATKDGRYTLSDQELTITKNGEKKQSILSENEKQSILQNFFGLTFWELNITKRMGLDIFEFSFTNTEKLVHPSVIPII